MRQFAIGNKQTIVCQVLLAAFCFSCIVSVRAPVSRAHSLDAAQETPENAYELLKTSETENETNHSQALQTARQALAIFKSLSDRQGVAEAQMRIAQYHLALGDLIEAKDVYETVLPYWREQNNAQRQAAVLISLSFIEQRKGDWSNTLAFLLEAQDLVNPETDPVQMAQLANSFGYVYEQNGLPDVALGEYERAQDYFRQANITRGVNRMAMYIGYMHVLRGDYASAATTLNQALASFDKELDIAQCREYLGRLHIALGQYSIARQHLQASLAIYQAAQNPMEVARVLALLGQIGEAEGAFALARTNYLDALHTFQQVEDRINESAANFALGKLELKAGEYDRAETYLKQSVENTEDLRRATIARDLTTAYSATVYERYQTYIECLLHKHKLQPSLGLDRVAFQTSELARARALAELLRDTQSSFAPGVNRSLATRERALRQTISNKMNLRVQLLAQKLQPGPATNVSKLQAELDQLEASLTPLQREHAQVKTELRQVNPLFDQVSEPTAYTLEQIQHDVIDDDQTVLLEFILGEQVSYAWAVTRTRIKTYELPKQQLIADAAEKVYAEASEEPNDERTQRLNVATERLAQLVLSPLAEELSAQRLIVVADGPLHYIPFQLLPAPTRTREPLIVNHEIVNAPSASILGRLRQETRQRGPSAKLLAAFGDPVFPANYAEFKGSPATELVASAKANTLEPWGRVWRDVAPGTNPNPQTLQPLTYSKFELQRLKDLGGPAAFVARGFDASRESLGRLNLSEFSVLHFATHGLLDPEHPELSGVVLSMVDTSGQPEDGFITIPDVYALKAPVDLVVLSACHTGLGKKVRGEGLIGLTSGFMHAGASSVAASLWKADDQATAKLMEYFYANMLEKNMRPADALRAAQNTMRTTSPWQSPHFWAAFTLQGEYRQPIRIPQPTGAPLKVQHAVGAALLLLLLTGIGWGYWRRRTPAR